MQYFKDLIEQTLSRTREATLGVLGLENRGLRQHLTEKMVNELGAEGCFLASPVFEHTFGWKESDHTLADLQKNLLSDTLINILENAHTYRFPSSTQPYFHQLQAWQILLNEKPKSVVITTGTGSGKTECFMVPILEDLIREQEKKQNALVGVRALFLYPLNALINSQQERLDAWTRSFGQDIRFCLYNGKTEETSIKIRKEQQQKPNQILSRELMRKEPAPILMTNATMLEYMLIRQIDNPILEISSQEKSLRWIVLDEAHTYIGSQAAEISLLLRRVIQAFNKKSEEIRFVATSATIAGKNAKEQLRSYLANLAGVRLDQVEVISGSRVYPDIELNSSPLDIALNTLRKIEGDKTISIERYNALCNSHIARKLRHSVVSKESPVDLNDLIKSVEQELTCTNTMERQREVLDWIDVMTGTRPSENKPSFLKLRIHIFQRMLHGLWACVNSNCSVKSSHLKDWPFGNVFVTQRPRCDCNAPVYEVGFCEECKTPHLLAEDRQGELHQISPYTGDEFSLNYENDEEDPTIEQKNTPAVIQCSTKKFIIADAATSSKKYFPDSLNLETRKIGSLNTEQNIRIMLTIEKESCCSCCEHISTYNRDFLRKAYPGAPFYVANAVPTILEFCPDPEKNNCDGKSPEELPGRGRKLITFTDSRQGTARMAVRMQQEAERSRLRGLVFEILRNAQIRYEDSPKDNPTGNYEEQLNLAKKLEQGGMRDTAEKIRINAELLRSGKSISNTIKVLSWGDMIDELISTRDIYGSILAYNTYTNPTLFNESGSRTMARLLLAREYSRRPKNQNSTETLGLVKISYNGLEKIESVPSYWLETLAISTDRNSNQAKTSLTIQDWQDFLKVALDFYVRENTFIRLDRDMQRWMGSRFTPKSLFAPRKEIIESTISKNWPQIKNGPVSRLVKLLELATGLNHSQTKDCDKINTWLEFAWDTLIKYNILQSTGTGHALNLETLTFSLPTEAWICPLTHRFIDTTFRGLTPYLPAKYLESNFRCRLIQMPNLAHLKIDGSNTPKLIQIRNLVTNNFIIKQLREENLWTDLSDRTVEGGFYYRTAEHSAQQSSIKLDKYVDMFKRGEINVLNCSTTMEMGVDIGGISAAVMNNVPPHPANYLQRAGRAGRRSESRAIAYTLCKGDPHNQRVFAEPKWPFKTAIPAPNITLSSDRIVQRHVNSLVLALYLRYQTNSDGDRTRLTVKWFFNGEYSPCRQFVDWLQSQPENINNPIKELVNGTSLATRSILSILNDTLAIIEELEKRWIDEYNNLNEKLSTVKDQAYEQALSLEKKRHENEYLLRDLAARTFLPAYGFPSNVVNINTYNIEDFKYNKNYKRANSRDDNIFSYKEQPSRGLDIAIREYAPGAQLVIDGKVYRSAGVSLQWHASGQINEAQKLDLSWWCPGCGGGGLVENAYSKNKITCVYCNTEIPSQECKKILRPSGFVTDFYEPTSNDISSQKYIQVEKPRVQLIGEILAFPDERCGYLRFGHNGSVFYHSSGENEKGYAICFKCGRAESMTDTGDIPRELQPDKTHRPVGGILGSHKEADCPGTSVMKDIFLGYQIQTDVLELFLKSPTKNIWLSDSKEDKVIASTLALALRNAIADQLGIAAVEMGFGYRVDKDLVTGQGRSVVQIFDHVSGGAGFVLSGLNNIVNLFKNASDKLDCPANCENICSYCLANQDSRVELEELDRKKAKYWLETNQYLTHLNLPSEMKNIPGATYCSIGPQIFIRSSINICNSKPILLLALRGEPQEWDLIHPSFREKILSWQLIDKLEVQLGVPNADSLPDDMKDCLMVLISLGVRVFEMDSLWDSYGVPLIAQICTSSETHSLFCTKESVSCPGESWLNASYSSIWVSSKLIPQMITKEIDTTIWKKIDKSIRVLKVTTELNGPITSLKNRLEKLFEEIAPEFYYLIKNDQAIAITYSDRYLKSPWSTMLIGCFLKLLKSEKLKSLKIKTLESSNLQPNNFIHHDWKTVNDLNTMMCLWLGQIFNLNPEIEIKQKNRDLQHSREISIKWASGLNSTIILDQGMGYWQVQMPHRAQLIFNFHQDYEDQVKDMLKKFQIAKVVANVEWPTYITISTK